MYFSVLFSVCRNIKLTTSDWEFLLEFPWNDFLVIVDFFPSVWFCFSFSCLFPEEMRSVAGRVDSVDTKVVEWN